MNLRVAIQDFSDQFQVGEIVFDGKYGRRPFFAVTGRLIVGTVVDRLNPRFISAGSMWSQAVALLCMTQTTDPTLLLVCCAAYGFSVGNIITLPALIVQREFPAAAFGMVLGLSTAVGTFAGALGPGLIGLIRDLTGDYVVALTVCGEPPEGSRTTVVPSRTVHTSGRVPPDR